MPPRNDGYDLRGLLGPQYNTKPPGLRLSSTVRPEAWEAVREAINEYNNRLETLKLQFEAERRMVEPRHR